MNRAELKRAVQCLQEIIREHADPDSNEYNECDKPEEECMWCDHAKKTIEILTRETLFSEHSMLFLDRSMPRRCKWYQHPDRMADCWVTWMDYAFLMWHHEEYANAQEYC